MNLIEHRNFDHTTMEMQSSYAKLMQSQALATFIKFLGGLKVSLGILTSEVNSSDVPIASGELGEVLQHSSDLTLG